MTKAVTDVKSEGGGSRLAKALNDNGQNHLEFLYSSFLT